MNPALAARAGLIEITQRQRDVHTRFCLVWNVTARVLRLIRFEMESPPPGKTGRRAFRESLVPKFELLGDRLVTADIRFVQIVEQTAALADHHQQPAARTVVFLVPLQVLGKVIDALGQQRNLHIGRAGVFLVQFELLDGVRFGFHTFR
jgi:hypothetical protein